MRSGGGAAGGNPRGSEPEWREPLRLLGIARRAGRAVVGTGAVRDAARDGSLRLAVVAADAGANARGRVMPLLEAAGVATLRGPDRNALGHAVGRPPTVVVGVTDPGLAEALAERFREATGGSAPD